MKIHLRGDWGMTRCGLEGWRRLWGGWDSKWALPNTDDRRKVTCRKCKRTKKTKFTL